MDKADVERRAGNASKASGSPSSCTPDDDVKSLHGALTNCASWAAVPGWSLHMGASPYPGDRC